MYNNDFLKSMQRNVSFKANCMAINNTAEVFDLSRVTLVFWYTLKEIQIGAFDTLGTGISAFIRRM